MNRNRRESRLSEVQASLEALRDTPTPNPERWQVARARFLAESRIFASQSVTKKGVWRHILWITPNKTGVPSKHREVSMMTLVKVIVALAVFFGGAAGTVRAAQESLPGSPLYGVKISIEDWAFQRTDEGAPQIQKALQLSQVRVEEAAELVEKGEEVPNGLVERYGAYINFALQASGTLTEPLQLQMHGTISDTLGQQIRTMQQAMTQNKGEDQQLQNMYQTMTQAGNMLLTGNAYQYAGDAPGTATQCQGDECLQVGPGEPQGNGLGDTPPNEDHAGYGPTWTDEPGDAAKKNQGDEPGNDEPGNDEPGNGEPAGIQDGNNGGSHQGDIGDVHSNGGNDTSGGDNSGGDNGGGDGGGDNGGGNGGGN